MKQLTQARLLSLFGMHAASAMLIRRKLEQTMRELVRASDKAGRPTSFQRMYHATVILRKRKVIDKTTAKIMQRIYNRASRVAHGNPATRQICRSLLSDFSAFRRKL